MRHITRDEAPQSLLSTTEPALSDATDTLTLQNGFIQSLKIRKIIFIYV